MARVLSTLLSAGVAPDLVRVAFARLMEAAVSNLRYMPDARAALARRVFSEAPSSERRGLAARSREMRAPPLFS